MIKKTNHFLWLIFLLFALILPVSSFLSTRILVVLFALSILFGERKFNFPEFLKSSWDILIYLFIISIGLIYSFDKISGVRILETTFSLLALPVICFRISDYNRHKLNNTLLLFSLGIFGAGLICMASALFQYFKGSHNIQLFFFSNFTNVIGSHPTYLAYYLIFAITFGLYSLNYEKPLFHPLISFLLILFFFFVLLLTGGQTAFVSLLLVFSFFILKFFLGDRSGNQKLTIGLVIIMMASMFFVSSRQSAERENNLNDSWDRFALWRASIDANPNVIFGVGTGDSKIVLNEYFRQHNLSQYANESLNSHNQFIQIYLSNGLIGLLALLLMLLRPLYLSFKNNSSFGLLVFFPFLIYGMTEVFLGRYQGVVFFALLHQLFVSYYGSSKPAFNLKEA